MPSVRVPRVIVALFLAAAGLRAAEPAAAVFEVYPLAFSDPASTEQAVRALVGQNGTVTRDAANDRLLVVAPREIHAQIAEVMRNVAVIPKNVRIDVSFDGQTVTQDAGASLGVVGSGVVREEGITHTVFHVKPQVRNTTTETSSRVTQSLLVASGRQAVLEVGEEVPCIDWLVDYGLQCGVLRQKVTWQRVGSSLLIEPQVVGDGPMIRVRLTPQLSGMVDGRPAHVKFANVATEVVVSDGQTFPLAGLDQDRDFYSRFLIGLDRGGNQEALSIQLTPHIMSPVGR